MRTRTALTLILSLAALASALCAPARAQESFPHYAKVGEVGAPSERRYPDDMPESYAGKLMPEEGADGITVSILALSKPFTCEIDAEDASFSGVYYVDSIQMVDAGLSLRYGSAVTARGNAFLGLDGYHARALALSAAAFEAPPDAQRIYPANPALSLGHASGSRRRSPLPERGRTRPARCRQAANTHVVATGDVRVRAAPSLSGKPLGVLAKGGKLPYAGSFTNDERGARWFKVHYRRGAGWVSAAYCTLAG